MQICAGAGMGWREAEKYPDADTDPPLNLLPKLTSQSGALCPEVSFIPKDHTLPTSQESQVPGLPSWVHIPLSPPPSRPGFGGPFQKFLALQSFWRPGPFVRLADRCSRARSGMVLHALWHLQTGDLAPECHRPNPQLTEVLLIFYFLMSFLKIIFTEPYWKERVIRRY